MVEPLEELVEAGVGPIEAPHWRPDSADREPVEAVLLCLPTPLAGKGTARQLSEAYAVLEPEIEAAGLSLAYVGPTVPGDAKLSAPLAEVEPAPGEVETTYRRVHGAVESAFEVLWGRGIRRVAVLSMGYTSYGPEAVRRALAGRSRARRMEAVVCVIDSSYPDVAALEGAVADGRWPESRFYGPAYRSEDGYETAFLLTSAYRYDPVILNRRAPAGLSGVAVISPPYSDAYVRRLERLGAEGKSLGGAAFADLIPGMAFFADGDLLVPLVASDIWSTSAVGRWMTAEQHASCLVGTRRLVEALVMVSDRLGRRVWVPMDLAGAELVRGLDLAGVAVRAGGDGGRPGGEQVVVCGYRDLSQDDHARLLGAAQLAVSRTGGQANASVVLALAKTPNLVVDLPACGYMQSELTSLAVSHDLSVDGAGRVTARARARPLGAVGHWSWPSGRLRDLILGPVESAELAAGLAESSFEEYLELRGRTAHSLPGIVRHLTGAVRAPD